MARKYWYAFTGPSGSEGLISNYTLVPNGSNCPEGPFICKIYAFYGGDTHPSSLSERIIDYIALAKSDQVTQPRTGTPIVLVKTLP